MALPKPLLLCASSSDQLIYLIWGAISRARLGTRLRQTNEYFFGKGYIRDWNDD